MTPRDTNARMAKLIAAATEVFIRKGYRRTQMADVTEVLGLSAGAIYRYVESKEALFDLVVRAGAGQDLASTKLTLPLATPRPGATLGYLRETLKREGRIKALTQGLARRKVENVSAELETIIRELYAKTARYRVGIMLLDRSALDWPELAALWLGKWRGDLVEELSRYLKLRISGDYLRLLPDTKVWARLIVETVAVFALHRHYDPYPTPMDEKLAEETAVDALVHATVR